MIYWRWPVFGIALLVLIGAAYMAMSFFAPAETRQVKAEQPVKSTETALHMSGKLAAYGAGGEEGESRRGLFCQYGGFGR